jgi:Zn finger protein HypA/HybF involved in hydrogenase expression
VYCPQCEVESQLPGIQQFRCPRCGQPTARIAQGKELEIVSLEYSE